MNQIIPVGRGILVATDMPLRHDTYEAFAAAWRDKLPDVPMALIQGQIVLIPGNEIATFEFTGDVSPTVVAEFQRWWAEVSTPARTDVQGVAQAGTMVEPTGRPPGQ